MRNPFKDRHFSEPTVCKLCHAVYQNGQWSWGEIPEKAEEVVCPACQRYEDDQPAGVIEIRGSYYKNHRDELLQLITGIEHRVNKEQPMERIMSIADKSDRTVITTTGFELARKIGQTLHKSYDGEVEFNYSNSKNELDIKWKI
ncbi:MAG TPA: BCAM0308 family protein [Balneolales bacterium]|nr:BCAM0308 family protein [Balneolales bacterium]